MFKRLGPVVDVAYGLSTNPVLNDSVSLVSAPVCLIIYYMLFQLIPPGVPANAVFSVVAIILSVRISFSPPHSLSRSGLLGGQGCEGKLRSSDRYFC